MTRPLDPLSLQHFVAVCEEGNIARAALRESLVASALSKRIAALEAEMGVPLLTRRRRGVEPTPAGQALLVRAREVLSSLDRLRVELGAYGQGAQGSVRVLASPSVLAESLPEDVAAFMARHPGIRITLDERTSPEIVRGVREGLASLGVCWDATDHGGLQCLPYRRDTLCLAVPQRHPLAQRRSVRFEHTLDYEHVSLPVNSAVQVMLQREAARIGRTLVQRVVVTSFEAALRVVRAGLAISVVPDEVSRDFAKAYNLKIVPLDEPWAERRFIICFRDAHSMPPAAQLLLEHLAAHSAA